MDERSLDAPDVSSPAQQLRVGQDLLQSAEVADAKGEDRLSRVVGKMSGYSRWEGQHHLSCDFHNTPGTPGGRESKRKVTEVQEYSGCEAFFNTEM